MSARTGKHGYYDVAIAGGGFVGSMLALALAKSAPSGFRVALIDAAPKTGEGTRDARAVALSASTRNLLEALELWPELAKNAEPIRSIEVTDSPLEASLRPHLLGFDEEFKDDAPRAEMVENEDLSRLLAAAVAGEAAIDCLAPETVSDFETDAYCTRAKLREGTVIEASLLVAADGKALAVPLEPSARRIHRFRATRDG